MKTQILSLIVAIISLTSINTNAAERSSENEMKKCTFSTNHFNHQNINDAEETLNIESWMTNDALWSMANSSLISEPVDTESELAIEEWMTNSALWSGKRNTDQASVSTYSEEQPLRIENWMTDDSKWR